MLRIANNLIVKKFTKNYNPMVFPNCVNLRYNSFKSDSEYSKEVDKTLEFLYDKFSELEGLDDLEDINYAVIIYNI